MAGQIIIPVLLLLATGGVTTQNSGPLYPIGGTTSSRSDDGSSPQISLLQSFNFFGQHYSQIYVNHNGHLTFDSSWSSFSPQQFPMYGGRDIIAPYWTDLDNRGNGDIYYVQYTSGSILQQVTQDINAYFPALNFHASWVFIATWHEVAYFPMTGTQTTIQAVLTTNGQYSFVLMNYGSLAPTSMSIQAGYDTISSSHHFSIPGSMSNNASGSNSVFSRDSNVNVPGCWVFRVDHGSRGCTFNGQPVQLGDSFWSDSTCAQKCTCTRAGLQCYNDPCSFSQICQPSSFQYSCQTVQRRTCTISGDPHYYTFDDSVFHFQGTCTYVLSEQCQNGLPYYRVEGKNEHRGSTHVSWTRLVKVFAYDETIELVKGRYGEAKVNGSFATAPFSLRNGTIQVYQSGFSLIVSTDFGVMVSYDMYSYVRISVPYTYQNNTCGLCGDFNNRHGDDFRTRQGEVVSSDVVFANSWKASGDDEPGCEAQCGGLACAGCTTNQNTLYRNDAHCGILQNSSGPFATCHQQLPPASFVDSCVYDLCVGGGYQPILCQALNVYSSQCQQNGIQPGSWRTSGFCEIPCPANSHYEAQATGCPPTCVNPNSTRNCPLPHQESCVCDSGYVLSGAVCVPHADCGCSFEGRYYHSGETVILDEDCGRRCRCSYGSMTCSPHSCGQHESCRLEDGERRCTPNSFATCWIRGPGSYHTFDGLMYQYPGACRLTLAKVMASTNHSHFMVTLEKVPKGLQSFSNVLKFEAEGTLVAIELASSSTVKVDGQLIRLPFSSGSNRIRIFQSSTHSIILRTTFGVTLQTVWPHFVAITAPSVYSGSLGGLCGNYNDDPSDEFRTPNGTLVSESQEFGDSWRSGSLADHCVESRYHNSATNFSSSEYCGVLRSNTGPFTSCWGAVDPEQQVDACVEILQGSRDPASKLCDVLRDYALMCQHKRVSLGHWRNATGCDLTCPSNSHYELCGSSCPSSCPSLSFPFTCDTQCQEGCQCNSGFVLNGNQCVPPTSCGCYHEGRYRQAGEQFWNSEECQSFCTCNGVTGVVQCSPSACGPQESCQVVAGEFGCHANPHGTCSASGDPHYLTFDGKAYDFQGTCRYVLATVRNETDELHHFSVKAKNEAWFGLPVSITAEVFVDVLGYEVHMSRGNRGTVEVNGITRNLPVVFNGSLSIFGSGSQTFVNADFGLSVMYDGSSTVTISVPPNYRGKLWGLCGNFNGNPNDDFHTPNGALVNSPDTFGAAWKVPGNYTCSDGCGSSCPRCHDDQTARSQCEVIQAADGPFSFCHEEVDPASYFNDCVFDVCVAGNRGSDLLCRALETYVRACQSANVQVYPWRQNTTCKIPCPANSHYEAQATGCPPTCVDPNSNQNCPLPNQESCVCDSGYVLSGGVCVPHADCGCSFEGRYYHSGETVILDEDCGRRCRCSYGSMTCSSHSCGQHESCSVEDGERRCTPNSFETCWIRGPGSYHTFDGLMYQYPGACRLTLANVMDSTNHSHFMVTLEKVPKGLESFSNVLKFEAEGTQVAIELASSSTVKVDGQLIRLPFSSGSNRIRIFQSSTHSIILRTTFGVTLQTVWPHFVAITAPSVYTGSLGGLCGNYNDDQYDEFRTPNGTLVSDSQEFGDSWRTGSLADHCVEQSHHNSATNFSSSEYCGVLSSNSGPFTSCWGAVDPEQQVDACVEILQGSRDPSSTLCDVLRDYALMCQHKGVSLGHWRNTTGCDQTCPSNSHYELCGSSCPSSCPSLSFPFTCDTECQEGCQCNSGFVLNGNQCVPPTSCGCYHEGRYRQAGEQFWNGEECQSFCTCNGVTGVVQCYPSACGPQESCQVVAGEFGCHPNPQGTCSASGDPHYLTFDGKLYDFQGTCRYVLATVCNETDELHHFSVKAKNEPWMGLPVSITAEVFVDVLGYEVHMSRGSGGTVEVNGITRNLPVVFSGSLSIFGSGSQTFVNADFGLSVMYDGLYTVTISVPPNYRGKVCGLCGNFNGNPNDDFHIPSGELVNSPDDFGAAWKVPGNYTCSDGCGSSCPRCHDDQTARSQCEVIQAADGPFSFCHEEVDPAPYFNDCVFDVCVAGNRGSDLLCRALETYVRACQSANVQVYPWRQNTICRIDCPANSHYELCGTDCGHTCASSIDATCDHVCSEGCFCDDGFSRSGTSCVPVENCGCQYEGFYHNAGESFWTDGCSQRCECHAPNVLECNPSSCTPAQECTIRGGQLGCYDTMSTCTVWGDPHYITFDGALAHFQGSCSYVITESLSQSYNETQYKVVATNKHRGNNLVSFVSSVDIYLSNSPESVHVRLGPNKRVKVNGAEVSLPTTAGTLGQVMTQGSYIVFDAVDVIVQFDGYSTLLVRMGRQYQNRVTGMCGNFNGDPTDDKVLPNGVLAENDNHFGQSWKSETSQEGCGSTDDRSGDGLSDCRFIEEYTELCRVITNTSGPFSSCHLHSDPQPFFTSCVYDLCLYTPANGMLCSAVSAYEKTCTVLGLNIPDWRSPLHCAETDPCEQLDCAEYEWCGKKDGVYGCFCDEHHHRHNNESYDSNITCSSSSGIMSISRCQLFEAGFHASAPHLQDESCNGTIQDGRLVFHFDNDGHLCGTTLRSNGTHFMYENTIQGDKDTHGGLISRQRKLHLSFCCVYPLTQALSMSVGINPVESILKRKLPVGTGSYQLRMIPYEDEGFLFPLSTNRNIEMEVDEMFYVEVRTEGVDQHQLSTVLDSCWATPVNQANYPVRWDLIISQCPNPEDGTVDVIQNGVSTSARFSFRMFTFTNHTEIFLHCNVHMCLLTNNSCTADCYPGHHSRFRRDVSYHDSGSLSLGPLVLRKRQTTGGLIYRNGASGHLQSTITLIVILLMTRILLN
ncbi:alpha-tectorin isoform 2-T2 [Fundulus diaphanus]